MVSKQILQFLSGMYLECARVFGLFIKHPEEFFVIPVKDVIVVLGSLMHRSLDGVSVVANNEAVYLMLIEFSLYTRVSTAGLQEYLQTMLDHSTYLLTCQLEATVSLE